MVQLQEITSEDLAKWWKEYVRQLAVLLVSEDCDGKLSPAVLDRISKLTSEQLALMRHVWVASHDAYELFQVPHHLQASRAGPHTQNTSVVWSNRG